MDEAANDFLVILLVDKGGILRVLEEVHGVGGVIVESIADLSRIPGYTGKVDDT